MKRMEKAIKEVHDELHGACKYAENYLFFANTHPEWAKMYHQMATEELGHADMLYKLGTAMAGELKWISEDDKTAWNELANKMAEKTAWVKLMLSK